MVAFATQTDLKSNWNSLSSPQDVMIELYRRKIW